MLKLTRHGNSQFEQIHQEWQKIDRECSEVIGEENTAQFAAFALQL
ncbi:hypothetical protein [Marinobacter sp.]